jgi:hypothetical protein
MVIVFKTNSYSCLLISAEIPIGWAGILCLYVYDQIVPLKLKSSALVIAS